MVKKGHKYVTLLQINVHRVMILSKKLYLRWRIIYLTERDIYLSGRDIYFEKGHNLYIYIYIYIYIVSMEYKGCEKMNVAMTD